MQKSDGGSFLLTLDDGQCVSKVRAGCSWDRVSLSSRPNVEHMPLDSKLCYCPATNLASSHILTYPLSTEALEDLR